MTRLSVSRLAGALYMFAVFVMCIRAGEPEHAWWWLVMIPFTVWIASPVLGGLWLVRRFEREAVRLLFLLLIAIVALAGFALQWYTMFIGPSDAQNALILLFVPLYQWVAVGLSFGLSRMLAWVSDCT